jgi:phage terminase small subunit
VLTAKQERFCREYGVDFNATQAALRSGYSKKTAGVIGRENIQKPAVKKFIDFLLREELEDIQKAHSQNMRFWNNLRDNDRMAKRSDKIKASELIGRATGQFSETKNVNVTSDQPINLNITIAGKVSQVSDDE